MTVYVPPPSTEVVEFPERSDDTSNAPLPGLERLVSNNPSKNVMEISRKRVRSNLCVSETKICLTPSALGKPDVQTLDPSALCSETLNVLQTVQCFANCWVGGHPMC